MTAKKQQPVAAAKRGSAGKATKGKKSSAGAVRNLFFSRDESWLRFNRRVLEEAEDPTNPLLERVKFLAITASNLDEFVEIRVAGVMQRIEDGYNEVGPDGLTPEQTFERDTSELRTF